EHRAAPIPGCEGLDDRDVAASDGVDGVDAWIAVQSVQDKTPHGFVETVAVVDLDQRTVGVPAAHRSAEPHLTFLFAAEEAATQGDQDVAGLVAEPLAAEGR